MESKMFIEEIERDELEVAVKDEHASTIDTEDGLGRFTPAGNKHNDIPITPLSSYPEYDREYSTANCSADQADETEQIKIRLAAKHREIKAAKDWLRNFPEWLHPKERDVPEVGDWIETIEAILAQGEMPRVVLGFMGPSGCGKSSVINALLNEESLLPCNCSEACTAVAVEVAWNPISDRKRAYRAKIQFVTVTEWKAELDILVAELMSLEPEARRNPSGNEAKVAAAKIKAVYPGLVIDELTEQSASELMNDIVVSKLFGKTIEIEMPTGKGAFFASEISQYIDSSSRPANLEGKVHKTTPFWPLVKVVQIFARSQVLSTGLVLVDLPGSGDSNMARTMVARDYINQVSAICIVADIKRAVTESVARNLFGRGKSLKRRLLRDGLLDDEHTFFVLTCTDIINNQQVVEAQGLDKSPEVAQILDEQERKNDRLRAIKKERHRLTKNPKKHKTASNVPQKRPRVIGEAGGRTKLHTNKRNFVRDETITKLAAPALPISKNKPIPKNGAHDNHLNLISKLNTEEKHIDYELKDLMDKLTAICIRKRNSCVTLRMKKDFSNGLRDLEEELREEGNEEANRIPQLEDSIRDGVDTFCVCSKAHQKFCGRFPLEDMPHGFELVEDTSIPQLYTHCMEYTLNARERLADKFLDDLARLRRRMRGWADSTIPDTVITARQKRLLIESFTDQRRYFEQRSSEIIESNAAKLRIHLQSLSRATLQVAVPTAAKFSLEIFEGWESAVQSCLTWKAICRKEGIHVSRAGGESTEYNWNDDLAEEFTKHLDKNLGKIPHQVLPDLHQAYRASIKDEVDKFIAELKTSSLGLTRHISHPLQNFMCNIEQLQVEDMRRIDSRYTAARAASRVIDRRVPTAIRLAMKPGYLKACGISGVGCFAKSKIAIENHIAKHSKPMYTKAATEVSQGIDEINIILKSNQEQDSKTFIEKVATDIEKMLIIASTTPRPESGAAKLALQKEILDKLTRFDSLLGEFRQGKDFSCDADVEDHDDEGDTEDESESGSEEEDAEMVDYDNDSVEGELDFDHCSDDPTPKAEEESNEDGLARCGVFN